MLFFEDLQIGQTAELIRTVTGHDIARFAEVSGDNNPVHLNAEFAAGTVFNQPIAHGMLVASFISALIGSKLPGPGAIYVGQTLDFKRAVRPGDEVRVTAEITSLDPAKGNVTLKTSCYVGRKSMIEGVATVSVARRSQGSPA